MLTALLSFALIAATSEPVGTAPARAAAGAQPAKPKKVCQKIEITGSTVPKRVCRTVVEPTPPKEGAQADSGKPTGASTN